MATRRSSARSASTASRSTRRAGVSDKVRAQLAAAIAHRLALMRNPVDERPVPQSRMAEATGLAQSRISQLLRGDTGHFSLERLIDIATQLELTVRVSITRPYSHG